ncbi:MAG: cytochrome c biogenesis protein CcsA [Myxococcales bacterium]|nr:cytochrome c biogenesis protein CcsA [Myxococcales bacterium]MCB9534512.1 cytochrome c biogenesis protein CcsA [Myxococcales bacterium]
MKLTIPTLHTSEAGGEWVTWLAIATAVTLTAGVGMAFFYAPEEATMGVVQRIFYFHVPSAIVTYAGFLTCATASVAYLVTGSRKADVVARAGAELGVLFCTAVLLSGPIWARKAWGTWWTGEPRLLLTLVMCLIFVAYLVVRQMGGRSEMTRRICAVLGILGVADIPLVRVAVQRWRGNHPRVLREGGIAPEMAHAFTVMLLGVGLMFLTLLLLRIRAGLLEEDVETWHLQLSARRATLDDRRS